MAKQEKSVHKNPRGRPAGKKFGETIPVRLDLVTVQNLDEYAAARAISRSNAIRTLLAVAFKDEAIRLREEEELPKTKASKIKATKKGEKK